MKIVFLNGKKRAGKDSLADYMVSSAKHYGVRVRQVSSIDPVRNAFEVIGIDPKRKTPEVRAAMADVGDALQKHLKFRSLWVCRQAQDADLDAVHVLIVHMREPDIIDETIESLAKLGYNDATKVFLRSSRGDVEEDSNAADAGVWRDNYYDHVIDNDGTIQELSHKAVDLLKILKPGIVAHLR